MSTPRRVILNSPYGNLPPNSMASPEDIRPAAQEDTESNSSTDEFWQQDEDLRHIIEGQLKEKSTDAPVPMPQPTIANNPLKLDFPAAEVATPWEEWQTVSETPVGGHATPFAPIGAPASSPSFPQPAPSRPEAHINTQISMPSPPPRFPVHDTLDHFGYPIRQFTQDGDLDSPQRIPGRYPQPQEQDYIPPAPSTTPPVAIPSAPSIYPPIHATVGVQADIPLKEGTMASLADPIKATSSPVAPSIYSESSSLSLTQESSQSPPVQAAWGKPTAPLKLGYKAPSVQHPQPEVAPTPYPKPQPVVAPVSSHPPSTVPTLQSTPKPPMPTMSSQPQSALFPPSSAPSHASQSQKPNSGEVQAPSVLRPSNATPKPSSPYDNAQSVASTIGSSPPKPLSLTSHGSPSSNGAHISSASKPAVTPPGHVKPETASSKPPKPTAPVVKPESSIEKPPAASTRPSEVSNNSQHTRYVNMLLALDDIPQWYNLLASFFTWVLLAGFLLFPGTFTSIQEVAGQTDNEFQRRILTAVTHIPLFVVAWLCCGVGAAGMIWLWWRWNANYIWVTGKIFMPGFLNSLAGIITTLVNVFGVQDGQFSTTAKVTIIVVSSTSGICGILLLFYQFWLLRRVKAEHDRQMGEQAAGKHGEGVLKSLMKTKNSRTKGV